jgi:oxidase EvaA
MTVHLSTLDGTGGAGRDLHVRLARSALAGAVDVGAFQWWLTAYSAVAFTRVTRIRLDDLVGWSTDPRTGNIGHDSGRFFTVEGLEVTVPMGPVTQWRQPVINQPEIGILGILAKEFDGVLHLLMQAKVEPGNCNGLQLSPTVQATRSNYTRVHAGKPVPYLEYFQDTSRHWVLADVRQSEQGAWFRQKRNRNMIVEVTGEVEVLDGFCWLTLAQVHQLLAVDDLVNMDARTVLSCLPFAGAGAARMLPADADEFRSAMLRSCDPGQGSLHSLDDVLHWITEIRSRIEFSTCAVPLNEVSGWHRDAEKVSHETGRFFNVIGVSVDAGGREVAHWTQPMIEPYGVGVVALLVADIAGVLHVLMHARVEAGYLDVVELAPTVQCTPENYDVLPPQARPRFLDEVLRASAEQIRYRAVLSEEGGRFYHARNQYLIVEVDVGVARGLTDYRWLTLHQIATLLRHSHYVNIQARSLVACLYSLSTRR